MIQILDHGYLQLVETWGSDERIIEAARMSTGKGFNGWGGGACHVEPLASRTCENGINGCTVKHVGDEKLLRYLWEHKHATPFEMAGMVIEVQAPIFVFREWHRHRTQCLAPDTAINLVSPRGTTYKRTIIPSRSRHPSAPHLLPRSLRHQGTQLAIMGVATMKKPKPAKPTKKPAKKLAADLCKITVSREVIDALDYLAREHGHKPGPKFRSLAIGSMVIDALTLHAARKATNAARQLLLADQREKRRLLN